MPEQGAADGAADAPSGEGSPKKANKSRKSNKNRHASTEKFTGKCPELKGHIFDYQPGKNMADACVRTLEELSEYAQRTCEKYPSDIAKTIEDLEEPTIAAAARPTPVIEQTATAAAVYDPLDLKDYDARLKEFDQRERALQQNKTKMFAVAWGQTSEPMRRKVEAAPRYEAIKANDDLVGLLNAIKTIAFNFETDKYLPLATHSAQRRFFNTIQRDHEDADTYRTRLENALKVIENSGGELPIGTALIDQQLATIPVTRDAATQEQMTAATDRAKEAFLGAALIAGANNKKYHKMKNDLSNNFAKGTDQYPKTINAAYKLLVTWSNDGGAGRNVQTGSGLAFMNVECQD